VAHNSPDDVAAAAAGVIGGVDPWVSLVLKPVQGITQVGDFDDQALLTFLHPDQVGVVQPKVNPVVHPEFLAGSGPVMGEGFTADGSGERQYIDIIRTIDDINRPGLRILVSMVRAMLNARIGEGEIDDYAIDVPIQPILEKDEKDRTPDEIQQLHQVQNGRQLPFSVSIEYAGAIHQLVVTLKFV